jgi:Holliday junction resolvase
MKESAIVNKIVAALRARGCFVAKLHGGPTQQAGLPDLLVIHAGRVVFLEVKRPGEQPTKLQEHTLAKLRGHGATAVVVTCEREAIEAVSF